jgi:hypothetical protein
VNLKETTGNRFMAKLLLELPPKTLPNVMVACHEHMDVLTGTQTRAERRSGFDHETLSRIREELRQTSLLMGFLIRAATAQAAFFHPASISLTLRFLTENMELNEQSRALATQLGDVALERASRFSHEDATKTMWALALYFADWRFATTHMDLFTSQLNEMVDNDDTDIRNAIYTALVAPGSGKQKLFFLLKRFMSVESRDVLAAEYERCRVHACFVNCAS